MHCCMTPTAARDRCVFTSVFALGALFAFLASPCSAAPMKAVLVYLGVPIVTFGVAAPSRIGLLRELGLYLRGLEAFVLQGLLLVFGRGSAARAVRHRHRHRVERAYLGSEKRFSRMVLEDPLRLHHARRLAFAATVVVVLAGLSLPLVLPSVYTFGDWPEAPFVVALDLVVLSLAGRLVTERVVLRLLEATDVLRGESVTASRARSLPVAVLLGGALGAVGSLVVVCAAAIACAIETSWLFPTTFAEPAFWFIRTTAPQGMPLGICMGVILGLGLALAQAPRRGDDGEIVEM